MVKTARAPLAALLLALAVLGAAAGCSDDEPGGSDADLRADLAALRGQIEEATTAAEQHQGGLLGEMAAMRREVLLLSAAMLENRLIASEGGVPSKVVAPTATANPSRAEQLLRHIAATEEAIEKAKEDAAGREGVAGSLSQTAVVTQELTLAQLRLAYFQAAYGLARPGEDAAGGPAAGAGAPPPRAAAPAPASAPAPARSEAAQDAGAQDVGDLIGSVKDRGAGKQAAALPPLEEVTVPQLPPTSYDRNDYARIQLLLQEAGHSPGPVDGHWGPRTQRAMAAFQRASGLPPSGEPDAATLDALGFY
jgi:peptidoglycan hydrolase-like protein with peptidoglycan-binding domain